jgi:hypothetical protein
LRPSEQEPVEARAEARVRVDQPSADNPPALRAGRPACSAGVESSRTPTRCVGRTIPSGWSWATGDHSLTAATATVSAALVASVGKGFPTGLPARRSLSLMAMARHCGTKPAGRTSPASIWGQGS